VADHGTTLRLLKETSRTPLPHFTSSALPQFPRHPAVLFHTNFGSVDSGDWLTYVGKL
jgi:hypothetical protein